MKFHSEFVPYEIPILIFSTIFFLDNVLRVVEKQVYNML